MIGMCVFCFILLLWAIIATAMVLSLCGDNETLRKAKITALAYRLQADELHEAKEKNVELAKRLAGAMVEAEAANKETDRLNRVLVATDAICAYWQRIAHGRAETLLQIKSLVDNIPEDADGKQE